MVNSKINQPITAKQNLNFKTLKQLDSEISKCKTCPRLVDWREEIGQTKRLAYKYDKYWAKPVPGFGENDAKILVVGLAPGAHGANRTGRVFTGDRSGDWLYKALFDVGLAKQPESISIDDGQKLFKTRITCAVHCAPPGNKPLPDEIANCRSWFSNEIRILWPNLKVIVALGRLAWDCVIKELNSELVESSQLETSKKLKTSKTTKTLKKLKVKPKFGHGASFKIKGQDGHTRLILASFHPSQQNTFTGKLTRKQLQKVFEKASRFAH